MNSSDSTAHPDLMKSRSEMHEKSQEILSQFTRADYESRVEEHIRDRFVWGLLLNLLKYKLRDTKGPRKILNEALLVLRGQINEETHKAMIQLKKTIEKNEFVEGSSDAVAYLEAVSSEYRRIHFTKLDLVVKEIEEFMFPPEDSQEEPLPR